MGKNNLEIVLDELNSLVGFLSKIEEEIPATSSSERLLIETNTLSTEVVDKFNLKFQNTSTKLIKLFSLSALCGEYISTEKLLDLLDKIKEKIISEIFSNYSYSFHSSIQDSIIAFSTSIKIVIELYSEFYRDIENSYSEEPREYIFIRSRQLEKETEKDIIDSFKPEVKYFATILSLMKLDHFPSNNDEYFIKLFSIKENIQENNLPAYQDLNQSITTKIDFILHKWKERRFQENPLLSNYREDGEERSVEDFQGNYVELKKWIDIFNTQYGLASNPKYEVRQRVSKYKRKKLEELNKLELHQCIKYYKDYCINRPKTFKLSKLSEISKFLINQQSKNDDNFYDKHVLSVFIKYSINNEFSKYIEKECDIFKVKKKYDEVKEQLNERRQNYFLEYKYLDKITFLLLPKIGEEDFVEKYQEIIDEANDILKLYSKNVRWSIKNLSYIFLLPFEESLVNFSIDGRGYKFFFASSFVTPPLVSDIQKKYNKVKSSVEKVYAYNEYSTFFSKERQEILKLKDEIKKKDFKSIEIIGIFTAVITFVLSTIPTLKYIDSSNKAILFIVVLSSSLSLFIILLLFSTRGFNLKKNGGGWLLCLLTLVIIVTGICGFNYISSIEKGKNTLKVNPTSQKQGRASINSKTKNG